MSSPLAGPLAAWMPPSSPHGWVYGVSRKRRGHRALDELSFYPEIQRPPDDASTLSPSRQCSRGAAGTPYLQGCAITGRSSLLSDRSTALL
ncbi:hypothetical protein XdyCFBP7245_16635 [Xanthomonas dyei]|uniref:Uncharacterized protein n=1 Tax=Xanthomonas dyei TaxID=743699 RepID=A0A2S7BZP7_9XANT|nr:hypothetical protein XdyCFBP7245_16635 [Xanthomonas dyei]